MTDRDRGTERLVVDLPAVVADIIRRNVESGDFTSAETFLSFVVLLYENADAVVDADDLDVLQQSIDAAVARKQAP